MYCKNMHSKYVLVGFINKKYLTFIIASFVKTNTSGCLTGGKVELKDDLAALEAGAYESYCEVSQNGMICFKYGAMFLPTRQTNTS